MWYWLILAGILLGLEMLISTLSLLFASMGALVSALIAYVFPDSLHVQIAVFALASLAGVLFWKKRRAALEDMVEQDEAIGHRVEVVPGQLGGMIRVRYRGTEWSARLMEADAEPAAPGTTLVVAGREGSTLLVARDADA